ncbi:cyclic nucleotide-binding protein [Thiorhodococcus drewsii AZ1]|uniref:Cyclic nucleotide-binding protein n=1 Tax=Thiorhodococcus drewsii AZ1 TaxID=765913 RepID=G2E5J0_9GAMM|nr:HDOD domain-containing protein [Thiorhodococcus drewsii]EGV28659.1 cyclic nucleotide-binding protein [Thiorhodococcus drewsii AZ1]
MFWRRERSSVEIESGGQEIDALKAMKVAGEIGAFPGLSNQDLTRLFKLAELTKLSSGQRLFESGDRAKQVYLLLTGCVQVKQVSATFVEEFGPGDWICNQDLAKPTRHEATAIARASTLLLILDAQVLTAVGDELTGYLHRLMEQSNRERLTRLRHAVDAFASRQESFIDLLFDARTRSSGGFAQSPAVKQLFSKVKALPVSSITLLNKMLDERTTKNEIVELVTMDPSLTSTLLRVVNSPLFGFSHKITNVSHAIVLMGHNTVYQVIMSESMRQSLPDTPFFDELHRRAIEVSRIAFVLSESLKVARPAEVATLGVLYDIGLVVIELLKTYNAGLSELFDTLDSAAMGSELMRSWNLPDILCKSIAYSLYPEFTPPHRVPVEVRANVAALYLARCCYQELHADAEAPPRPFIADYLSALGYPDLTLDELLRQRVLPKLRAQLQDLPAEMAGRVKVARR